MSEVKRVVTEKYVYNGVEYETLTAAEKARVASVNIEKAVLSYSQAGKALLNRFQGNWPLLVLFKEKYGDGDRYFIANSSDDLRDIFTTIFKERFIDGWYEYDEMDAITTLIMDKNDFFAMIGYIRENAEGEYARYKLENFEIPTKWS